MSTIVTRAAKGSPLTHAEVDANFTNLNTDKYQSGDSVTFTTLTANSTSEFGRSSANYVRAVGAAASNGPVISSQGSDTNINLNLTTKGTGAVNLNTGSGIGLKVTDIGATGANWVEIRGGVSGGASLIQTWSTGGAAPLTFSTRGNSNYTFNSNANSNTQFVIASTASAVNYVQVTGAATTAAPVISAQGSDANIVLRVASKGTQVIAFSTNYSGSGTGNTQFTVSHTANSVNNLNVSGAVTGAAPNLSTSGGDTNIDLALTTKGTGAVRFNTGGGEQLRITDTATAVNYWVISGNSAGNSGTLGMAGTSTNVGTYFYTKGSAAHQFLTNGNAEQLRVTHTASAVNYVQVTGAATGVPPVISSQGSDTNIHLTLLSKGSNGIRLSTTSASNIQAFVSHTASAVNFLQLTGSAAGSAPVFSVAGTDTNIDLALTPKGTGLVRFGTRTATSDVAITGYLEIKDSGGTTRKLAIID